MATAMDIGSVGRTATQFALRLGALWLVFIAQLWYCTPARSQGGLPPSPGPGLNWALLVGASDYELPSIRDLPYCEADVEAVARALTEVHGFAPERVTVLKGRQATKGAITEALARLMDPTMVGLADQVIVYFAGHGQTVPLPRGGEMGFLVPSDAPVEFEDVANLAAYYETCIGMDEIRRIGEMMPARHVFFIIDACYSGLAIDVTRGAPALPGADAVAREPSRHVLVAGMRGEQAIEDGALGHGVFTASLLEALTTPACDYDRDGVILAREIATYVQGRVPRLGAQTPQYATYGGEGQFLLNAPRTGDTADHGPTMQFASPESLRQGDLRLVFGPMGGRTRVSGLVVCSSDLKTLTMDGVPVAFQMAQLSELPPGGPPAAAGEHAYRFSTELGAAKGEARIVELVACDAEGAATAARLSIVSCAPDSRAPDLGALVLRPEPAPASPTTRYLYVPARRGPAQTATPATPLRRESIGLGEGESLLVSGAARDDRGAPVVAFDGMALATAPLDQEERADLGWDDGVRFEGLVATTPGLHQLTATDPAGNVACVEVEIIAPEDLLPRISISEPVQERGSRMCLPPAKTSVHVVGSATGSADIASVAVGGRQARLMPAPGLQHTVSFESDVPLPEDGAVVPVEVEAVDAEGRTASRTISVRRTAPALHVQCAADRPDYRFGDPIRFRLTTNREAYTYLFHVGADGALTPFLPNVVEPDVLTPAGVERVFPSPVEERRYGDQYRIVAAEPAGEDVALCIALPMPIPAGAITGSMTFTQLYMALDAAGRPCGLVLTKPTAVALAELTGAAHQLGGVLLEVRYSVAP